MTRKCPRCMVPMKLDPKIFCILTLDPKEIIALKTWTCPKCGFVEFQKPPEQPQYRRIKKLEEAADLANLDLNIQQITEATR